ncbi:hypothetical protein X769_26365 [Mesorhizobium sp. LSJC268A00]|uniref:hypothetical protein n=1 Tax=unclassified Mesorhizobium TaxID=325217 RepID=UPI0003CF79B6|nr:MULTISPECIES: hypothetical protein [unclassified Mesorhizobium]ESW98062.1 hypothetical protein X769_26365 [Mesorhizobium sp. LSJC268A00]ESX10418.1 hypothetical protein X768_14085 [Mesorhizobium sp. LSJC265A00]ESX15616.1 hypothetical protein X766_24275 [Mesorhizobium sp. LSJC255A00]WJI54505.1 hypothetical protein NLY44_05015 [Mesorhizobium sp. C089B]
MDVTDPNARVDGIFFDDAGGVIGIDRLIVHGLRSPAGDFHKRNHRANALPGKYEMTGMSIPFSA